MNTPKEIDVRRHLLLAIILLVMLPFASCTQQGAAQPTAAPGGTKAPGALKVAMIMPGPTQDGDFNALGAQALAEVKSQTGAETALSESVAVADAERVGREYLNSGYNVVLYHGAQFLTVVQKLAPAFPNANFGIVSSVGLTDLPPNVWNIRRKFHEGFYPVGTLAAGATKTKTIGYVSGVRLPEFVASYNAMWQAIQDVDPSIRVLNPAFVGDQNDPVKAREAAAALYGAGADVVVATVNLGVNGVAEAARAANKPVFFTTFYTEKAELAPDKLLVSLLVDFSTPYVAVVKNVQNGKRGGEFELRPGAGMNLSEIRNAPPEAAQKAKAVYDQIAAGQKQITEVTDRTLSQ
ncbi:MAG: BMP family protein [Chloroflexota bacterium]